MTDLTEQWKKGELSEGEKYIQLRDNRIFTAYFNGKEFREVYNSDIKEILAEVPTFDELRANQKWIKSLEEKIKIYERKDNQATETSIAYNELLDENQQLKELLYKCREKLDWLNGGYVVWGGELTDFIEEIDNAIGEKK